MRMKSRKDTNQVAIVKELRELGYDVDVIERPYDIVVSGEKYKYPETPNYNPQPGDILCWATPCSVRVELKSEKGKLSESQKIYYAKQNHKGSILVAYNIQEIIDWFNS